MSNQHDHNQRRWPGLALLALLLLGLTACSPTPAGGGDSQAAPSSTAQPNAPAAQQDSAVLPALTPVTLGADETLQVAATTSIIGDIVAQIGGDHITLYTLMAPGVDPHSYTPTPQDLRTVSDVDVIFINGLHLEEGLEDLLNSSTAPQISVNATVTPLANDADAHAGESHEHGPNDPHTWQDVTNVMAWVEPIEKSLSTLDPAHAEAYHAAAQAYQAKLAVLDAEIRTKVATLPVASRKLVTDHESFAYFAHAYGFTVVGTLIPSLSSMAESSAQDLAALQDQIRTEAVPAIFVGATVNPNLAEQLASDLGIVVVPLYSDALSANDGPAASYLDFMRYNVDAIVTALGKE